MATEPDPYRILGLPRTASLAEVKAAYRRLAKANHPDAAGEAALPRFLAIQAAYERLAGPIPGRPPVSTTPTPPRKPWEADPDRSDATRRAYGGRARRPAGSNTGKSGGRAKAGGPAAGRDANSATGSPGAAAGGGGAAGSKDPKKATLGSTSYDGADREAFEPDWVGGSWYGTTSGTYWTINPKEYADPRKHGPEYQARARRAAQAGKDPAAGVEAGTAGVEAGTAGAEAAASPIEDERASAGAASSRDDAATGSDRPAARPAGPDPTPRHTTSSWWDATSGPATPDEPIAPPPPRSAPRPRQTAPPRQHSSATASSQAAGDGLSGTWRALTQGAPPSFGWRIARAVIGWLPIALAIGWAVGEVSGCARYAATCGDTTEPATWAVQALVLVLLFALPVVAGWAVIAALVSLAVAVPATLFVTASAGAEASRLGTGFLGVVLAVAWVGGIVGAIVLSRRRPLGPTGPVS